MWWEKVSGGMHQLTVDFREPKKFTWVIQSQQQELFTPSVGGENSVLPLYMAVVKLTSLIWGEDTGYLPSLYVLKADRVIFQSFILLIGTSYGCTNSLYTYAHTHICIYTYTCVLCIVKNHMNLHPIKTDTPFFPLEELSETTVKSEYLSLTHSMPCRAWCNLIISIIIVLDVIRLTFSLSGSG